jgi:hypothetical protein
MRVADKLTPEPIMSCFHNQGKSQMLATPELSKKLKTCLSSPDESKETEDACDRQS